MRQLDFTPAIDVLEDRQDVCICGHLNPDGDSLGSVLALTLALRDRGYTVVPLLANEATPRVYDYLPLFDELVYAKDYRDAPDVFISVDVPGIERTGAAVEVFSRAEGSIAIDHHLGTPGFADAALVDPQAPSCSMLVWDFIAQMGITRTPEIATCCYTGLVTDTGRFQFQNADADALSYAAEMVEAGADPAFICTKVYQRKTREALMLEALAISRMRFMCAGGVVLSWTRAADLAEIGAVRDDTDSLVNTIRCLDGVEVAVMLREEAGGVTHGSIRSKSARDVSHIAAAFGGGGHAAAAGFTTDKTLEETVAALKPLLERSFAEQPAGTQAGEGNGGQRSAQRPDDGRRGEGRALR